MPYARRQRRAYPARRPADFFLKGNFKWCRNRAIDDLPTVTLLLRQPGLEFRQRDVRLFRYQFPDQLLMRRQHKILVAAELGRADATRLAVKLEEAHDRAYANPALLGSFRYRSAGINRLDYARSQVLRIRLRHPCWPPPSRKLESYSPPCGNPRFSLFGNRSRRDPARHDVERPGREWHHDGDRPARPALRGGRYRRREPGKDEHGGAKT